MFGLFKNKAPGSDTGLPSKLLDFLDNADEEYMRAFAMKSIRELQEYCSRDCAVEVSRSVFATNSRYFGSPKFRKTTWMELSRDSDIISVLKEVTFDKVKVGGSMKIGVADNYSEEWKIDNSGKQPVVMRIKAVEV